MLTVLTWLWRQPGGRTEFTVDHVSIWAAMVRRHLDLPHRIACVTDLDGLPSHIERITPPREFEDVRISTWGDARPQCLRRISMFSPDAAETFGERFICMDLDVVITADITPMVTDHEFRIAKGTAAGRPYNGSMMLIEAGKRAKVYREFTPQRAERAGRRFIGSDQAWISDCLGPDEATWSEEDGLGWYGRPALEHDRIVFFPGDVKPWHLASIGADDRVLEHYRGSRPQRCLVLGHSPAVWNDVARVIDEPFDAVIASPEAAAWWKGPIMAVANCNGEAMRLAAMHGFSDIVPCGMEA